MAHYDTRIEVQENTRYYGFEQGARYADIYIRTTGSAVLAKVCSVLRDIEFFRDHDHPYIKPVSINWSAWGSQSQDTTSLFVEALSLATEIADSWNAGVERDEVTDIPGLPRIDLPGFPSVGGGAHVG